MADPAGVKQQCLHELDHVCCLLGITLEAYRVCCLAMQDVVAVNLVNQHGSEGILAQAFQDEAQRFGQTSRGLRLVAFDFHKQCGASNYKK